MGRITIFSIEECNFCRRTKAALSARDIPYNDINLESYPSKRADMISLTDKVTVPQVLFNDEHVGGSEETLAILEKWDEDIKKGDCNDNTPHDRYVRLIESKADPTDERLSVPTGPPAIQKVDFSASRTKVIFQVDDKKYTTLELTKLLIQRMPRDSLSYRGCLYYNVFKGSSGLRLSCLICRSRLMHYFQIIFSTRPNKIFANHHYNLSTQVTALQKIFNLESREESVQLGLKLQRKDYIHHVCKDHAFGDNGYYFILQPFRAPKVLNSFRVWCDPVDDEPMHIIHRLGKLWSKLESNHLNENGMLDHSTMRNDDLYWKFEEEVCELQHNKCSLKYMDDKKKMAYVINVYNLMIKYAFVKVGVPATNTNRASFFEDVSVDIGGCIFGDCVFGFNALEHGILRANTRHPYQLTKPFGSMDSRKRLALKKLDPRIHFALNCGAKSCPPVKKYTAEAIDEELRFAAMAFCEQDDNVVIDEVNCQLKLSKILYWYQSDFVRSKYDLPQKVLEYLRGEKKDKLMQEKIFTVKFLDYDWSSNDINAIVYEKGGLSEHSVFPYFRSPPPQR